MSIYGNMRIMGIIYHIEIEIEYLQTCMLNNTALGETADFDVSEHNFFPDDDKMGFSHMAGSRTYTSCF